MKSILILFGICKFLNINFIFRFDFFIVLISILEYLLNNYLKLGVGPSLANVFRLFRVFRVLKLAK
jgi:hypothetical protein